MVKDPVPLNPPLGANPRLPCDGEAAGGNMSRFVLRENWMASISLKHTSCLEGVKMIYLHNSI